MTTFAAEHFYGEIHRAETSRRGAVDAGGGFPGHIFGLAKCAA
jgi:hypothetical protein